MATSITVSPDTLEAFNDEKLRLKKQKKLKMTGDGLIAYLLGLSRKVNR